MKDKITEESFEILIGPALQLHKGADNLQEFIAQQCFELHQRTIKQMLDEAGSELPTIELFLVDGDDDSYKNGLIDMHSESSKVILKKNEEIEKLKTMTKTATDKIISDTNEITQLKGDIMRFVNWIKGIGTTFYTPKEVSVADLLEKYESKK